MSEVTISGISKLFLYLCAAQTISATLWAGTNSGQILIFLLNIPIGEEKRKTDKASAMLAKEIQLKHKAPVISVQVILVHGLKFKVENLI